MTERRGNRNEIGPGERHGDEVADPGDERGVGVFGTVDVDRRVQRAFANGNRIRAADLSFVYGVVGAANVGGGLSRDFLRRGMSTALGWARRTSPN